MSKLKIHTFDPVIYPRQIFVVKGRDISSNIKNTFTTPEGDTLNMTGSDTCRAAVWNVKLINDKGSFGVLVWLKEKIDVSVIAHESVHAANYIFSDCGIKYNWDNDEHFAHLIGFIADCLNQVWTGKFKD